MKFFVRRQTSIALANEPGQLARICGLLADAAINIDAISVLDNVEQGMVRLLTSNSELARSVLDAAGLYVVEAEVLEVDLPNSPGALQRAAAALAGAGINIEYAYGTESTVGDTLRVCLKVDDTSRATRVLRESGGS